jgi:hypothetical protein
MKDTHSLTSLRQLFLAAARAVPAAAVAVTAVACGGSAADDSEASSAVVRGRPEPGLSAVCATGETYAPLKGLTPANAVAFLELRQQYEGNSEVQVSASEGTACGGASDVAACTEKLASFRSEGWETPGWGWSPPYDRYLVYTRGDSIASVTSLADLATFLAPIENPKDAALLLAEQGHTIVCGANVVAAADGLVLTTETGHTCGAGTGRYRHKVKVDKVGTVTVLETELVAAGDPHCAIGRRPEGFTPETVKSGERPTGDYFAQIAELEAASVFAFERLAAELAAHGAPIELIEAAQLSARDEVRHTSLMNALARRYGREPLSPSVGEQTIRGLFEIALENAAEGCVRETFGALQATFQARRAGDGSVRRVMEGIALDETRHAALAWLVAAFIEPQLSADQRAAVDDARRAAVDELARGLTAETDPEVIRVTGAPSAEENALLLAHVRDTLWPTAAAA